MNRYRYTALVTTVLAAILVGTRPATPQAQAEPPDVAPQPAAWDRLKSLAGTWINADRGSPGAADLKREFELIIQDRFLFAGTKSVSEKETHEDWAIFSFDKIKNVVVMRQFVSEGYVNRLVLDKISPDGKSLVFLSEHCENAPPGFRVRMTYTLVTDDEFAQELELAAPGAEFSSCVKGSLRREK